MLTVEAICKQLSVSLCKNAEELAQLWIYVGYEEKETERRVQKLSEEVERVFGDFIQSENAEVNRMNAEIETYRRNTVEHCQQLGYPPYLPERGLTTCQLKADLQQQLKALEEEKKRRLKDYMDMRSQAMEISIQLGHPTDVIKKRISEFPRLNPDASTTQQLPSKKELSRLQSILDELRLCFNPLFDKYRMLKDDLQRLAEDVDYEPKDDLEIFVLADNEKCDQITHSNLNSDVSGYDNLDNEIQAMQAKFKRSLYSETDLEVLMEWRLRLVKEKARLFGTCDELRSYLESIWSRLEKPVEDQKAFLSKCADYKPKSLELLQNEAEACRLERLKTLKTYLPRLKLEAIELARSCFVEQKEQTTIDSFAGSNEELVDYLEKRIEELKLVYQRHRQVYDSIAIFQNLWSSLLEVEQRMRDPTILANRGGILLKTEKEKKRLLKEIQKAETDAHTAILQYEDVNNEVFRISTGETFLEAARQQWKEFKAPRESSKVNKRASSSQGQRFGAVDPGPPGAPN